MDVKIFQNKQSKLGEWTGRRPTIGHVSLVIGIASLLSGKGYLMQWFERPCGRQWVNTIVVI